MTLTRDYEAKIRIFYTSDDFYKYGRDEAATKYLNRHGWSVSEYTGGKDTYRGIDCRGYISAKKSFIDIKQMEDELDDIEAAFHDCKTVKDGYYTNVGPAISYDKDAYVHGSMG